MQKNLPARLLAFALALTVLALIPPADAQGTGQFPPEFTLGTPTLSPAGAIKPDIGTAQVSIPWTYSFSSAGTNLGSTSKPSSIIVWQQPTCDRAGVLITGTLAETIILPAAPETSTTGTSKFNVEVTQEAPGETAITCTFQARVAAVVGTTVGESSIGQTVLTVRADFLGLISVNVPQTIKQAGPQKQIRYDLEITNLGNARSDIIFTLSEGATEGGWNPLPPPKITLESTQQGGQNTVQTVAFTVATPFKNGWNNKETSMILTVTPQSTKDVESAGASVDIPVLARVRGVYVPTLEPLMMLGAVFGAVAVLRRRS